jgi:hypothetical protein
MTSTNSSPHQSHPISDGEILLVASDLLRKGGFQDGELLDEILEDAGFDIQAERPVEGDPMFEAESLNHVVLTKLVVAKLEGLLPEGSITTLASRSHNPVRVDDTPANREALKGFGFTVSHQEIVAIATEVMPEFTSTLGRRFSPGP